MCVGVCARAHVDARGQLAGVSSLHVGPRSQILVVRLLASTFICVASLWPRHICFNEVKVELLV